MTEFMEVYGAFPWVKQNDDSAEYVLRDDNETHWPYYEVDGTLAQEPELGIIPLPLINPQQIVSVKNGTLFDDNCDEYFYCEILMSSGERFWLSDFWNCKERRESR